MFVLGLFLLCGTDQISDSWSYALDSASFSGKSGDATSVVNPPGCDGCAVGCPPAAAAPGVVDWGTPLGDCA